MRIRIPTLIMGMACLLLAVGVAGAQQKLLSGKSIPKFVDPLPVASTPGGPGISVINATSVTIDGLTPDPLGKAPGSPLPIGAYEFQAQILPTGYPASWVWGYLTPGDLPLAPPIPVRTSYLGPVVVAQKGVAFYPKYENSLPVAGNVQINLPIDMTLDWANPFGVVCGKDAAGNYTNPACGLFPSYLGPVPIATHLHGGEVAPAYDGGPDAWFTPNASITGPGFPPGGVYHYPNDQQEGTIWFHDHALGITRLNVFAGLAGLYPIVDYVSDGMGGWIPGPTAPAVAMPKFPNYDIPLIIQDRSFDRNGQIFYNLASNPQPNPTVHPFWIPEFIGDVICVNGKTWPFLNVEPRQYRFRLVNGSNARFYDLTLSYTLKQGKGKTANLPFVVIATDDGYLQSAVSTPNLIIGPGERYEIIVDFKNVPANTPVTMMNAARTPFPAGAAPTRNGTDTVMQFRVNLAKTAIPDTTIAGGVQIRKPASPIQPILTGWVPPSTPPTVPTGSILRQLTLNEVIGAGGPLELVVNNSKFNLKNLIPGAPTVLNRETELPAVGDTEVWEIINITADAHPMHTHLTSFQILERIPFDSIAWAPAYDALLVANGVLPGDGPPNPYYVKNADGAIGGNPGINAFLLGPARTVTGTYEEGWKDTAIMYPGEVTRIVVRWAPTDVAVGGVPVGTNLYPFAPTALINGVGYVWHCHIIDHEDNEMMRNYVVGAARQQVCNPGNPPGPCSP